MSEFIDHILYSAPYWQLYLLVVAYFLLLYFAVGRLFLWICRRMAQAGWLHQIVKKEPEQEQISYEIRHSLLSIFIFGFSGIAAVFLIRQGIADLLPDSLTNILLCLAILTLWNEVHFFIVHRIMHLPFLMKHVHYVHHRSKVSNIYSVFSFHWLEALLLSTVQICIMPFVAFAPLALALFPLVSILLNFAGHANYRFGSGEGGSWFNFATRHSGHHSRFHRTYGFATPYLDKLYDLLIRKK